MSDDPVQQYQVIHHPWRWFEDIPAGESFDCGSFAFSEAEIIDFARRYDPQVFHVDPHRATETFVGQLFASALHTLTVSVSLFVRATRSMETVVGLGLRETAAPGPALAGVSYTVRCRWVSTRLSRSRPGEGIVVWEGETIAPDGSVILRFGTTMLLHCRRCGGLPTASSLLQEGA